MKNITHKFKRLPLAERVLFFSSIFCLIFTFFPSWFTKEIVIVGTEFINTSERVTEISNYNAYTWVTAAVWYFYLIFIISLIVIFILSLMNKKVKSLLEQKNWIYIFITGESLFLLTIILLVSMHYSFTFFKAGIWAWLILCIISNFIALFSAHFYFLERKNNKIKKEFISQMKPNITLDIDKIQKEEDNKSSQMSFIDS